MKQVTCNNNDIGPSFDDVIDDTLKRQSNVGFTLIDAVRCLPVVLAEAEVKIGQMSEFHLRADLKTRCRLDGQLPNILIGVGLLIFAEHAEPGTVGPGNERTPTS